MTPGDRFLESVAGGVDPIEVREAADRAATLLVRGARETGDPEVAERLLHLADTEGIEAIAEVWAGSPADSVTLSGGGAINAVTFGPGRGGDVQVDDLAAGVYPGIGAAGHRQFGGRRQPQHSSERCGQHVLYGSPAGLGGPPGKG